jgi:hypothetical protein
MIDCSKTENYLAEKKRMTKITNTGVCEIKCTNCPLNEKNNGKGRLCVDYEMHHPEEAISIVQRWSNAHPRKTYLTELLKHYPNAELSHGVPKICLKKLGVVSGCAKTKKGDSCISCYSCWNQHIEDGEE